MLCRACKLKTSAIGKALKIVYKKEKYIYTYERKSKRNMEIKKRVREEKR